MTNMHKALGLVLRCVDEEGGRPTSGSEHALEPRLLDFKRVV